MSTKEKNLQKKQEIKPGAVYITEEAAVICCVEPSTIRHQVRVGKLKGVGRPYRFMGHELLRWLQS